MKLRVCLVGLAVAAGIAAQGAAAQETIKSLEDKTVEIRPGKVIRDSSELARQSYRDFLDLASTDPELHAEALRRLGDLELESHEADQLASNVESLDLRGFNDAAELYLRLLEAYPDYRRNDTVLYQLSRAYEAGGRTDEALDVLDELVRRYPDTAILDEVQFRRGEMLFLRKKYNDAEMAYQDVVKVGERSRYFEQSLYKLGWSQFKLAWYEDSLTPFFDLLDRKIRGQEISEEEPRFPGLSRAENEIVGDTFRVLSISFSYLDGAATIGTFLAQRGTPEYAWFMYESLGNLYLEKERFQDAAETYEAFARQDPYHDKAPVLQAKAIAAYKDGGFPSLVLDGKKNFVERYGMDGPYWERHARSGNEAVVENVKSSLGDLAQYHHAEAQKSGRRDDYAQAAYWYRKTLDYFPGEPDSANINFLLAESLYDSGRFAEAVTEYEATAYGFPAHEKSAEAGYAAILAYREHEKSLAGADKVAWHEAYLESGLKFAETFPDHAEAGAVLTTVADDLFRQNQFDLAIRVGEAVVGKQPPVSAEHARTAWAVIAHSHFDRGRFVEAEQAYYSLRNVTPSSDRQAAREVRERIASSIYKQGEAARDAGDLETAVTHFRRLGKVVPDSDIRETAEYDAAAALINLEDWDRASVVLEEFRRDFPNSQFADEVTESLAVSYLESNRSDKAAGEFERIAAAASSTEEVRREALWRASELYEETGSLTAEQRVLRDIVARYPNPVSESIEARARLLEIAKATGNEQERLLRLREIMAADAGAGPQRTDRTRYLAAMAALELAEPVRRRFESARLTQPLANSLPRKRELMEEVIKEYTKAADYGVAAATTAATYRLGEVYEQFSADLMGSDRPRDLAADALEQYEILLEEQAFPFEEKAIELFAANADRAASGVYDEWVQRSFERLASLMPGRYAKQERSEDVVTALK